MVNKEVIKGIEKPSIGRPLIVSYSYSGNTHTIAEKIQTLTGGDWCEIYPWQPYPMDYQKLISQAKREIAFHFRPKLLPAASPRSYSVIFVGSPNWCGTIAPPVASWLVKNDLSYKVILPFCSSGGGPSDGIGRDIAGLCPKADVRKTLNVVNDGGADILKTLEKWLEKNGVMELSGRCIQPQTDKISNNMSKGRLL